VSGTCGSRFILAPETGQKTAAARFRDGTSLAPDAGMAAVSLTLSSSAFRNGEMIPDRYTCDGADDAPELRWEHAPSGTRSYVLLVEDPDAPHGTFTHWVRYDLPAALSSFGGASVTAGIGGRNDFETTEWGGPCPPPNHGDHRYYFRLYALDVASLDLPEGASIEQVREAIAGHVLAEAELMGRYRRTTG